jgi:hypothetical protein
VDVVDVVDVVVEEVVVVGARVVVVVETVVATVSVVASGEPPEHDRPLQPATAKATRSKASTIPMGFIFISPILPRCVDVAR